LTRVGVSAIAREGVDARTLRNAVGHVPDTAMPGEPGNAAFATHRDTFFRGLKDVRTGDRVVLTTPCYPFDYVGSAPKRFIVRATISEAAY
jgi:sortase A